MTLPNLSIIVAVDQNGGFSKNGTIPWFDKPFAKEDLKHFKDTTINHACIMGRKTYQDMFDYKVKKNSQGSTKNKLVKITEILPKRESFVITKTLHEVEGATTRTSLREAVHSTKKNKIFVIGGEKLFIESLPWVTELFITMVPDTYNCDRFLPLNYVTKYFDIINAKKEDVLTFITYKRRL